MTMAVVLSCSYVGVVIPETFPIPIPSISWFSFLANLLSQVSVCHEAGSSDVMGDLCREKTLLRLL